MTTDFPSQSAVVAAQLDTGPLSWVMNEIREALGQSISALQYLTKPDATPDTKPKLLTSHSGNSAAFPYDRTTALHYAKTYLHQAHGALQMVDINGVTIITETVEDLLERALAEQALGRTAVTTAHVQSIQNAYQALIEYLEDLLSGGAHQPVKLFPYYKALLEIRGADRVHPADLFFPDLTIRPQFAEAATSGSAGFDHVIDYLSLRKRFEMALLPFLKSADTAVELANATSMCAVIAEVVQLQHNQQARAFWWVMQGFADGVAHAQVPNELYVKQLFARINLQLRRLSQGSSSTSERLLRDALFFVAGIQKPSALNAQIRSIYRLDGVVPADFQTRLYEQVNFDALRDAKEHVARAKNSWDRLAAGDASAADEFEQEMLSLSSAGCQLNAPSLSKLLRELSGIARHAAHSRPGEPIGLEIATSLLFVENTLTQINRLPANFSEHADAITVHLLSVMSGETPSAPARWLDDIYRAAQQKKVVRALAGEILTSLRHVENLLDVYFGAPEKRDVLPQIDHVLHQIQGALAIQEEPEALAVVTHTRATLQQFLDAPDAPTPGQQEFERIAQNIGALSFYVETMHHQPDGSNAPSIHLNFDAQRGVYRVDLLDRRHKAATLPYAPIVMSAIPELSHPDLSISVTPATMALAPSAQDNILNENSGDNLAAASNIASLPLLSLPDLPTVEEELLQRQQRAIELILLLMEEPQNPILLTQLQQSLTQMRVDAALSDDHAATERAQAALNMLNDANTALSQQSLSDLLATLQPRHLVENASNNSLSIPAQVTEEEADAELLEIFLSEAEEVLTSVRLTIPKARLAPLHQEHLVVLRRAFHTLKGSSRMIGMNAFGDAAWSIEQVLNSWLTENKEGTPALYALLDQAFVFLDDWIKEIYLKGDSPRTAQILSECAQKMRDGELVPAVESATDFIEATDVAEQIADLPPLPTQAEEIAVSDVEMVLFSALPDVPTLTDIDDFSQHEYEYRDAQDEDIEIAVTVPKLTGIDPSAAIISFPGLPELRQDDSIKKIGDLSISLPLYNIYLSETDQLVRLLSQDFSEWRHEPERPVAVHAMHAAHSLAGSSATVGFKPLRDVAHALEMVLQRMAMQLTPVRAQEFDIIDEAVSRAKWMLQQFAQSDMPYYEPALVSTLDSLRHGQEVRFAAFDPDSDKNLALEDLSHIPPNPSDVSLLNGSVGDAAIGLTVDSQQSEEQAEDTVHVTSVVTSIAPILSEDAPQSAMVIGLPTIAVTSQAYEAAPIEFDPALALRDEIDVDLLPIFLEEGRDILPQIESGLRSWKQSASIINVNSVNDQSVAPIPVETAQAILRHLHTIKGSARMAGAMVLGQHMHEMESHIAATLYSATPSPHMIDELLAHYDYGVQMFENLEHPQPHSAASVNQSIAMTSSSVVVPISATGTAPVLAATSNVAAVAQVRVNAEVLDRLVNQAGEVAIVRSRLESGVGTLQQSLLELTENVDRLRGQLREIEIQAETQMSSRMTLAGEREFDPLEFDRFTRLQELTRMMAESVNDVSTLQKTLTKTVDDANTDLVTQGRLTRDLQRDLMHVRMVPFASVAERLYRLTRQVSKEMDKRVNLDIRGSTVEIDRSVLEKMVGPFEHLLRNAIVHGIESREGRRAAGKSDIGELKIEIRQNGNEVLIQLSDDGQGLNLPEIRGKAKSIGLLHPHQELSDVETTDLIFRPGFTTVTEITKLAGRGVGMDVVRSEAAALGGRVAVTSEAGKGTHFTIHLPLTLAVTQVVIFSTGGNTYAVPSALVEQVLQLKATLLASAYNDGSVLWQEQRVPLHYLSTLLGKHHVAPVTQQYTPIIILRSGNDRVAIHVDEIIGNREVVVKNIGPQLSRLIGIVGATVLGSGEVVLILNPVPLAQRYMQEMRLPQTAPIMQNANAVEIEHVLPVGAVADNPGAEKTFEPVPGLRTQKIVMVVDDSLTVRRVTQRLLSREGYQVVLAKDGIDALQQLQAITPDLMLVDIEMPRMDGFDLTRNIRNDERTRDIPIIMITSRTAAKHRTYAMELGVNDYLGKPYQEDVLLGMIGTFIRKEVALSVP
ncbi:Hpt domain-containing protein [Glaciimonas sp. PCH181]|uniref:Hpt domain-containing protein n=1 Tax=Glaciimonas sp. PCH181 TaxID=2133943 RepID=UPI000D3752E4|nr:Hpt domain-containing protein [Glaciimonas sp. PCH181]PUA20540.1 hybrid sensor histidine kinase/response regulator [Glaciimonas sp. PCH181]